MKPKLTDAQVKALRYWLCEDGCTCDSCQIIDELLAFRAAAPNESRELCFARCVLGNKLVTDEIRALAEDTVARAKIAKRKRG